MSYWTQRQKQLYAQMEKDETALKKRLSRIYDVEYNKLDKLIQAFYTQYGQDNIVEYRKLLERLSTEDVDLLMQNIDEFTAKYPEYAKYVPIRENIYKLNRLEGLQQSVVLNQLEIGARNEREITAYLNKQALRGLNTTAKLLGTGLYTENSEIIQSFVNVPWSNGKNFSTRIWENTDKLANYLNTDISQGFARGDSYQTLIKRIRERYARVTRNDAYRLIFTEGTYVMAHATMQPFEQDFEYYRLSTAEDSKVCPICRAIQSNPTPFRIADKQPGVNFPPLHPWCRCTFEIVVDDWDEWLKEYIKNHSQEQGEKLKGELQ